MVNIFCDGKTLDDCMECNAYYSSHSLHEEHGESVSSVTCSIGGHRTFNEDGSLKEG